MEGVMSNPGEGADRKLSSPREVPPHPGPQSRPARVVPPPLLCQPPLVPSPALT